MTNSPVRKEQGTSYPLIAIRVHPGLTSEMLLGMASSQKAVILETNAMGSVGERLYSALRDLRDQNIPVFILPDNAGEKHGVIRIVDDAQRLTEENGGIFLEKANVNTEPEVIEAIKQALDDGKTGHVLGGAIREQYSYKEGEEKPISRLGTPEGLREYREDTIRNYYETLIFWGGRRVLPPRPPGPQPGALLLSYIHHAKRIRNLKFKIQN